MKLRYKIANGFVLVVVLVLVSTGFILSHNADCEPAPTLSADAETMQAVMYRCYGSTEVLELEEAAKPVPAEDEVLVKISAASVNPLDWHYMRGSPYIMRLASGIGSPDDHRLGVDFAGTVEAIGANVTDYQVGDEVFGGSAGAFAEYLTIPVGRALTRKPANLDFEQLAAVPIAGITALQALRDKGLLQPEQKVLINGASGGVGTFAVQIAKAMGAEVTGVCSTRNLDLVRSLGADHVIDYKQQDYTEMDQRYDLIIDMVGNHSLLENRQAMTPTGRLVLVGGPKGDWGGPLLGPIKAMLLSPFVGQEFVMLMARMRQEDLVILSELMQEGKMKSVIDRRFTLSEVPAAIAYSEKGHARGKIIVNTE